MKTIAFWSYDTFPFCLWGELLRADKDGFWVHGYSGMKFSHEARIAFIPEPKANQFIAQLEKLTADKEDADARFKRDAKKVLESCEAASWADVMPKVFPPIQ